MPTTTEDMIAQIDATMAYPSKANKLVLTMALKEYAEPDLETRANVQGISKLVIAACNKIADAKSILAEVKADLQQ